MLIKLEWLGSRMVKTTMTMLSCFSSNPGTSRADRQTDRIALSITRVSVLTRDKIDNKEVRRPDLTPKAKAWGWRRRNEWNVGRGIPLPTGGIDLGRKLYPSPEIFLKVFTARRVCIARTMPWQDVRPSVCHTPVLCLNGYSFQTVSLSMTLSDF